MSDVANLLSQTPTLYPIEASPVSRDIRLIQLDETAYAQASFLDGRLLTPDRASIWTDWATVDTSALALSPRANFIFHTGHVGSTLLSRLLGEHPQVFALREPALLREAATGSLSDALNPLLRLLARTWRREQTALIKATSFVSEIGPELLERSVDGRAVLLSATPPVYLRTILAGQAAPQEAGALARSRQDRLERRLGFAVRVDSVGEQIAMGWLSEAAALMALADGFPARCLWLDFDHLLAEPPALLAMIFRHLGVDAAALDLSALVNGPIMGRYSKAPEHAYDATLRRRLLTQAEREHATEIRRGMDWLGRIGAESPLARAVLQRSAQVRRAPLSPSSPPIA